MVDYAGAAVGTAFGELFGLVKDVVKTVATFRGQLKKIESTLSSLEPIIKDIDKYNNMLECPQEMDPIKVILEEGKGLVDQCSRIHMLNLCMKYTHSKDLTAFNVKVMEKFWIYISLVNVKTGKETEAQVQACRAEVKDLGKAVEEKFDTLIRVIQGNDGHMPPVNLAAPTAPDFIVGLEASLRELKEQLLEEGVSMRVVTGPSGCGKTTLLKKLCHDPDIEGKFKNNIMFVPVSKNSNLTDIVQNMIHHMGFMEPTIQTEDVAVLYLQQLLDIIGENPVLLVLDDVSAEWENILEKFVFRNIKDYKIVVTSTYDFPRYHPVHRLNQLTSSEASKLLRRSVFVDDKSVDAPYNELLDKLNSCSWQILKRCHRLPLVLTVVAKSLRGKNSSFRKRLALPENSDILDCLQNVLDYLRQCSIKERFMDLSAFPEDCKIPATALIDMWVELYELDFDGRRAIADLWDLDERSLAELVVPRDDNDSYMGHDYSGYYAVQHDLLRKLAIRECNEGDIEERVRLILELIGNKFPDWWSEQKQQPLSARLVSISTGLSLSLSNLLGKIQLVGS